MNIPLKAHTYPSEFELVQACKKAVPLAQHTFYHRYAERILILCFRYTGHREDAKELLADVFVSAFGNFHRFEYLGEGSVQAWLSRIAVNCCLMYLRKRKLHFEELKEGYEVYIEHDVTPFDCLSAKELIALIHSLPVGYRTVFNLYVFEEMGHKEIAAILDISESTSKTQLHKARQLLQKQVVQLKKNIL